MSVTRTSERARALLRIALGTSQVFAATVALVLLLQSGVNAASVGATVVTLRLALASKPLFGKEDTGVAHDGR